MEVWGTLNRHEEAWQNTKDRAMKPSIAERSEQVENVGVRPVQAIFFLKVIFRVIWKKGTTSVQKNDSIKMVLQQDCGGIFLFHN